MATLQPNRFKTITEYHKFRGMPAPAHPLISVINLETGTYIHMAEPVSLVFDFYSISLKRMPNDKVKYGQQSYDFDEGLMFFMAPGQVFSIETAKGAASKRTGWVLLVHPDFLWGTPLAKKMKGYEYFSYSVHEALHLSTKEEATIGGIMQSIEEEYHATIDGFSQDVMIAHIELLLTYSERFYHRQFITRKISNHQLLERLEELLEACFKDEELPQKGIPTVQYVADTLHVSPGYLSMLLRQLTGQSTQQHIHNKLIERAKEKITTTNRSVGEIAYELGFEHAQSFSKLFKTKTNFSPLEFRQSFN
jgi:AraC family transcriptional activator of pobA